MSPETLDWIAFSAPLFFAILFLVFVIDKTRSEGGKLFQEWDWPLIVPGFTSLAFLLCTIAPGILLFSTPARNPHHLDNFSPGEEYIRLSPINQDRQNQLNYFFVRAISDEKVFFVARPREEITPEHFLATKDGLVALTPHAKASEKIAENELYQRLIFQIQNPDHSSHVITRDLSGSFDGSLELPNKTLIHHNGFEATKDGYILKLTASRDKQPVGKLAIPLHQSPLKDEGLIGLISLEDFGSSARLHILDANDTTATVLVENRLVPYRTLSKY